MAESGLPVTYGIGQDARCGRAMEDAIATASGVQNPAVRQGEVEYISVSFYNSIRPFSLRELLPCVQVGVVQSMASV